MRPRDWACLAGVCGFVFFLVSWLVVAQRDMGPVSGHLQSPKAEQATPQPLPISGAGEIAPPAVNVSDPEPEKIQPPPYFAAGIFELAQQAGIPITKAVLSLDGQRYSILLRQIIIEEYAPGQRLLRSGFIWFVHDGTDQGIDRLVQEWFTMKRLLAAAYPSANRDAFNKWGADLLERVRLAPCEGEVLIGDLVAEYDISNSADTGPMITIAVARLLKPQSERDRKPRPASWKDLRPGLTLPEVQGFAGEGSCSTRASSGMFTSEVWTWASGPILTFENGRLNGWFMVPGARSK